MKHYFAKIGSIIIALMIVFASVSTAFAEDTLKINGANDTVKKGETVHFTLNLSDTRVGVSGFELRVFFDQSKLELIKGSIKSDSFDNLFYNSAKEGKVHFQWTDVSNPVDCSKKTPIFSCDFKVLDGGESEISFFVTELFDENTEVLKCYSWTYDLTSGDKDIVSDGVLPISKDPDTLANRQSHYINYVDGKGEENSPNKDNHESVVGEQRGQSGGSDSNVVDVTKDNNDKSGVNPWIFILIAVPVIGGLIAAAIIVSNKKNKKSDDDFDEPKFDLNAEQQAMEEAGEIDDDDDGM